MNLEIFSTAGLPSRTDLARRWEDANRRMVGLEFRTKPHGQYFHASSHVRQARKLRFSALSVSAHLTTLGAIRDPGIAPYHLVAHIKDGTLVVEQDGRQANLQKGDFVIVDTSRPFLIDTPGMLVHSIDILTSRIREILPQVDGLTSLTISGQSAAAALLRGIVDNMFDYASEISDDAADYISDAIHYSAASALAALPAARDVVPNSVESLHRHRIRNHVRANLRNRELDPETIARALDLPLRYVHKLFEDEPVTLMKWVWSERIARCQSDLAKPELRNRSISAIAYSWGFSDPAHFSRLFKAQTGKSPSAVRGEAVPD